MTVAVKIAGWVPDADETTPGILLDVTNMLPSMRGYRGVPGGVASEYTALAAACVGSALVTKNDGNTRLFAGSASTLYEGSGGTWSDVSRVGGYSLGSNRWQFAQFGNTTLAATKAAVLQSSTTGNFANLTAPKASLVETVSGFVFLADCDDTGSGLSTSFGDQTNRWWCSAFNDATSWAPSVATQCTSGLLVDTPGPIKAMKRLGDSVVIYKRKGMWLGSYVEAPVVWQFDMVKGDIGAAGPDSVINVGPAHYFYSPELEDFFMFDGNTPSSIGTPVREWFADNLNKTYDYKIQGMHDNDTGTVWWFYPASGSTTPNAAIIYNYKTGQWGKADIAVEATVDLVTGAITYANLDDFFATYADLPAISYDSPFWSANSQVLAYFDTSHNLKTFTGASSSSDLTTGKTGDDEKYSLLRRVKPRYSQNPTTASLVNYYADDVDDAMTADATTAISGKNFDVLRSSRWHKFKLSHTGDVEITHLAYDFQPQSEL